MTTRPAPQPEQRSSTVVGVALLGAVVASLLVYKGSGSVRALARAASTGALGLSERALLDGGALAATARYFVRIAPALAFGVVLGAVVRSTVSPRWVASLLGRGRRAPWAAAACGAPLMLCSCCVSPVFTGVYARGARLGPALALMLASPGLNVAALALTFVLMPLPFALLRVAAALLLVLVVAPAIGARLEEAARRSPADLVEPLSSPRGLAAGLARDVVHLAAITLPLVAAGALASSWLLPHAVHAWPLRPAGVIAVIALGATCIALPTFFEIPLAALLLRLGAPPGAAVALLVAGPLVNLPSLFVLARDAGARVAVSVAVAVWVTACFAGWTASLV